MSAAMMREAPFGDFDPTGMEVGLTPVGGAAGGAAGGDRDGGGEKGGGDDKIGAIEEKDEEDEEKSSESSESGDDEKKRSEEGKTIHPLHCCLIESIFEQTSFCNLLRFLYFASKTLMRAIVFHSSNIMQSIHFAPSPSKTLAMCPHRCRLFL